MNVLVLIGRIVVGGYYLYNALNHLVFAPGPLSEYAAAKGVPAPMLAVIVSGLLLLIGGLSILLGVYTRIGVLALVLFFLPVTFWMHDFWAIEDPGQRMMQMVQFLKNLALMGSALMFLAIPEPWPYSVAPRKQT
ncbi:MAG: DoxX family protein [Candidatus Kapabacteria bacterium]|nr:DoxX family protein [Candidatus Kapabacteria bacterium]MDW8011804.1 DoxX family protein [Bacteroidota bacterium]